MYKGIFWDKIHSVPFHHNRIRKTYKVNKCENILINYFSENKQELTSLSYNTYINIEDPVINIILTM